MFLIPIELFDIGIVFKVSYVKVKLHISSHRLTVCLNDVNRLKIVIKRIRPRILKIFFEQSCSKKLYAATLHMTNKLFV